MPAHTLPIEGEFYTFRPCPMPGSWSAEVDSPEGKSYFVSEKNGHWSCTCPGWRYSKDQPKMCKHLREVKRWRLEHPEDRMSQNTPAEPGRTAVVPANGNTLPPASPAPAPITLSRPVSETPARLASPPGPCLNLAMALAKAQKQVRRVDHDATVNFGQTSYDYTSSEAVIEAAKDPLSEAGLALLPLEETLNGHEKEGANRFELECKFLLLHSSGESLPLVRHWPVCPDRGRALDKATAAASTLCLAYLLRDLLLMPRVAPEDEVPARNDTPQQQERPHKQAKKEPPPATGAELKKWLKNFDAKMGNRGLWEAGDLYDHVLAEGVSVGSPRDMAQWDPSVIPPAIDEAKKYLAAAKERQAKEKAAAAK